MSRDSLQFPTSCECLTSSTAADRQWQDGELLVGGSDALDSVIEFRRQTCKRCRFQGGVVRNARALNPRWCALQ